MTSNEQQSDKQQDIQTTTRATESFEAFISLGPVTQNNINLVKTLHNACLPVVFTESLYSMILEDRELCRIAYVKDIPVGVITCRLDPYELSESTKVLENYSINFDKNSCHSNLGDTLNKKSEINKDEKQETETSWDLRVPRTTKGNLQYRLCILTLAVLKPYRRMKIGTTLVEWVYNRCYALRTNKLKSTDTIAPIPCIPTGTLVPLNYIYLHVWSINTKAQNFYESLGFVKIDTIQNYYKNLLPSSSVVFVKPIKV